MTPGRENTRPDRPGGPELSAVDRVRWAAVRLGLHLDDAACATLVRYMDLLARWGAVHNLSAIGGSDDALVLHLFDSLSVVPLVARTVPAGGLVLDVGSGGGLPGVVIAVAMPNARVVCIDAVAKKAAFIRQVAIECGLPHLDALHARVEHLGDPQAPPSADLRRWARLAPGGADLIVSRAFASLPEFVKLTHRAREPARGLWMAMKGRTPDAEMAALATVPGLPSVEAFHVEPLNVPDLLAHRCAVWIRPTGLDRDRTPRTEPPPGAANVHGAEGPANPNEPQRPHAAPPADGSCHRDEPPS